MPRDPVPAPGRVFVDRELTYWKVDKVEQAGGAQGALIHLLRGPSLSDLATPFELTAAQFQELARQRDLVELDLGPT